MIRSVVSSGLSVFAVLALAAACGGSNATQDGFTNTGTTTADASAGGGGGDDASSGDDSTGNLTNVGDGGLIPLSNDSGGVSSVGLDGGCATATSSASRTPVYLQFVLDGSNSMNDDKKWTTATAALKSIFGNIQSQNDDTEGVGLEIFSDLNDPNQDCNSFSGSCTYSGTYPSKIDIPIRAVDSTQDTALDKRMSSTQPHGDTPMDRALKGAYASLESFTASSPLVPGGKKVVVIITDGVPSDGDGNTSTTLNNTVLQYTTTATSNGIETFVIGVGPFEYEPDDYDPKFLGALAVAGGTRNSPTCNPNEVKTVANACYFQVTPNTSTDYTQEFIDAINDIRGEVASCTYQLSIADGGTLDPSLVNVIYTDGMGVQHTLVQDPTNGWSYNNPTMPTEVILNGTDCSAVKSDPGGKIDIVIGCATVVNQPR